ncbi:MAG: hypothetical protein JO316_12455 [Abitibacteriaceae bacterium]|nr:hypothetical protein [Abditibacteriaceae bacterium]
MNTLSKETTGAFFQASGQDNTLEGYAALQAHWSSLVNSPAAAKLGPEHHLLYQALRGKDWRKAFAPITNSRKLANGAFYNWGLQHALRGIHSQHTQDKLLAPFGNLINEQVLQQVRGLLPKRVLGFEVPQAYERSEEVSGHD